MFRRMDKNKNGTLSREEFALGLKETGLNVNNPEISELFKVSGVRIPIIEIVVIVYNIL